MEPTKGTNWFERHVMLELERLNTSHLALHEKVDNLRLAGAEKKGSSKTSQTIFGTFGAALLIGAVELFKKFL